jgi:hypothetical protein
MKTVSTLSSIILTVSLVPQSIESVIMDEVEATWPTLHPLRHQHHDATNRLAEHHRMPTWPSPLQTPENHASPQLQPDLYLQLSQILEWEIWNHNQTRGGLCLELARRTELEAQVCRLNQELAQWQESNRIAYGALDEHRAENSNLKLDVEALTDELRHLREQVLVCGLRQALAYMSTGPADAQRFAATFEPWGG